MTDLSTYKRFLESKVKIDEGCGFEVPLEEINPALKPHTRAAVQWALRGGRRGIFARFGLHKTATQLEIMRLIGVHQPCYRLIVLPLGVRQEFALDAAEHFSGNYEIKVKFVRSAAEMVGPDTIYLTNYESVREGILDVRLFGAISLDEAAVLRSFGSKTFGEFLFGDIQKIPYRFVATATPDPNEFLELIAYAHFLGVMDMGEAKTRFFKRNSEKADQLTLHPHKEEEFWLWVASWALFIQRPSDLGFSDEGYDLPELDIHWHEIPSDHTTAGVNRSGQVRMFKEAAVDVSGAAKEKRDSLQARVAKMLELRDEAPDEHRIIWHDLEAERAAIEKAIPTVSSIYGTQDLEEREELLFWFRTGKIAELAAKPVMLGAGGNLQRHCHHAIYLGIGHKFNDFIQSVHRLQRFGQQYRVRVDLIYTEAERETRRNLEAKWERHKYQAERMSQIIRKYGLANAGAAEVLRRSMGIERAEASGPGWLLAHNDCVDETTAMEANSVGMVLTSIPFSGQYEYTPSFNDFGHTDDDAHFFGQMDFLTPQLLRVLEPGRVAVVHVKDRVTPGAMTGLGYQTISPFHAHAILHYIRHGFSYMGMISIETDVVRENAQTYRLGWGMKCEDSARMGVGMPEYLLIFRKPPTEASSGWSDRRVEKPKEKYTRARWQFDAHAFWPSSANRLLTVDDIAGMAESDIFKLFKQTMLERRYDHEAVVALAEALDARGKLPPTFMLLQPQSRDPSIWTDVVRMRSLNAMQAKKGAEKHLCPLPFDIVDRAIGSWSNEGDLVYDPFAGLGTVPLRAVELGRRGRGSELNPWYWRDSVWHLEHAKTEAKAPDLFDVFEMEKAA